MKLNIKENIVESNIINNQTFTIRANAHSFALLSDGLYSDKIKAIVRELSTNAIDSHIASKNSESFEIKLPNALDSEFYVKDYGLGLSKEEILGYVDDNGIYHNGLYNTYFESSKQNSNDFIGALGLGSKTPFNYVSSFYVISNYNGIESTYVCHLNDQYVPTVSLMIEKSSEDSNGLMIKFNVEPNDFRRFRNALEDILPYLMIKPRIIGCDISDFGIEYYDRGYWKVRKNYRCGTGMYIIQGGVSYPIKNDTLRTRLGSKAGLLDNDVDVFVNIGDVDVAASREQLSYSEKTLKFLYDKIVGIYDEYCLELENLIDGAENIKDLCNIVQPLNISNLNYLFKDGIRKKAGKLLDGNERISVRSENNDIIRFDFEDFNIHFYTRNYGKWVHASRMANDLNLFGSRESLLIVNRCGMYKKDFGELFEYYHRIMDVKQIYIVNFIGKEFDDVSEVFSCFNNVVYVLPIKKVKKKVDKNIEKTSDIYYWNGYRTSMKKYSSGCWKYDSNFDYSNGGIYVDIKNFAVLNNGEMIKDFSNLLYACRNLKIHVGNVYGISEKNKKYLNDKWVNLFDIINSHGYNDSNVIKYQIYRDIVGKFEWFKNVSIDGYKFNGKVKECYGFLKDVVKYKDALEYGDKCSLYIEMNGNEEYYRLKNELNGMIRDIKEEYPMLKYSFVSSWMNSDAAEKMVKIFVEYLKGDLK